MEREDVLRFFFELGQLRRSKHEGWRLAGVEQPESIADHSLRAAQIGFVLALLEGHQNPHEVCAMLVFHDIGETRIGDIHKLANRYVSADEEKATRDQLGKLGSIGAQIFDLWTQVEQRSTPAGVIAKDADYLEQALCAQEYTQRGYAAAQDWIRNVGAALRTESAKQLLAALEEMDAYDWWKGLKSFRA